jgi:hypothetical protein
MRRMLQVIDTVILWLVMGMLVMGVAGIVGLDLIAALQLCASVYVMVAIICVLGVRYETMRRRRR